MKSVIVYLGLCPPEAFKIDSKLSKRRDMSSIFANISLETPANLFESELSNSSTTMDNSVGEDVSVVVLFID